MAAVIHTEELTKCFTVSNGLFSRNAATVRALDRVSIDVQPGEIVGLIGESGSGKTTLARVLLGLTEASGGKAQVNGHEVVGASHSELRALRADVAVVFQDPAANLNPRQTVEQSIIRPLMIRGMKKEEARKLAAEAMTKVKMDTRYLTAYPHQLSGGQQQRIAIARAIVMNPKVMILDEPTSALDISVQAQVLNLLLDLQEEYHLTYLVITHDINVIRYIADRVAVMYMGRLVEYGSAEDILDAPVHPYTINLEKYVPVLDPRKRSEKAQLATADSPSLLAVKANACVMADTCPYVTERCRSERPPLREVSPGHTAACFRHLDK